MGNNTQIQLEGFGKLTIKEGSSFPLNFNIQNLKEPDSTPSAYSKDIIIIGDNDANILLGQAFDVNISNSSFDINKKVSCNVIQNGSNVFENGFFQLINVEKTGSELPNGESEIKYTGRVKSDLMSFFTTIKNKDLTDLNIYDPSTYTLLFRNSILATFNNDVTDKYKFIPYDNGGSPNYAVKYFKPATYLKTYWDAIHKESGFEYQFDELEDLHIDKLLIPYTGGFEVEQETKDTYEVIVEDGTFHQQDYGFRQEYLPGGINTRFDSVENFTIETKDEFNQFNLSTDSFTAAVNSEYTFNFQIDFDHFLNNLESSSAYIQSLGVGSDVLNKLRIRYELRYRIIDYLGNSTFGWKALDGASNDFRERDNPDFNNPEDALQPGNNSINSGIANCSFTIPLGVSEQVTDFMISETYQNPYDENVTLGWRYQLSNGNQPKANIGSILNINSIYMTVIPDLEYDIGTPVHLNKFIPKGVKQRDIVKSVIDMYKLIVEIDPIQPNKLIYTTRDKYYDDGEQKDWTKKLAKNKKINQQWLVTSQGKTKKYTYKKDKDSYNTQYSDAIGDVYGEYDFDYLNEYNVGEDKVELTFSPTPTLHGESNDMFTPALKPDEEYNIRLLYDGGTKDGYYFIEQNDGSYSTVEEGVYPLITHQDNPVNPGFDLNFGNCEFYFHNEYENITQNNLWTLYHRRSLSQLYKGKLVTAFFQLDSIDILNFKYNDRIFINDSWYNVNKIVDYDANSNSLTKVELVTVDDGLSIDVNRIVHPPTKPNPSNPWVVSPWVKGKETRMITNNTIVVGSDVDFKGKNNTAQSNSKGNIIGDNNTINGSSMIIGNKSSDGGLDNKLVVGTNKIASEEYNALIGDVNLGEKVNIGEVDFTKVGMTYQSEFVADNYVADGYTESFDAGITFDASNDGNIDIQANTLDFNTTTLDFTNVTNIVNNEKFTEILYADLVTLKSNADLDTGSTYHITDRDIWTRALATDNLATGAARMMRCPLTTYYTPQTITGFFDSVYLGIYGQTTAQGSVPNSDDFIGGDIYYVIWGGKLWKRDTTGADGGTTVQDIIDGTGWDLVNDTDGRYEDCYFSIGYDFDDDFVSNQRDLKGNDLIGVETLTDVSTYLNMLDITDWNDDKIYRNKCYGIYNNYGGNISSNSNLGSIYNNSNNGSINNNSNTGSIYNNLNSGSIYDNSNLGSIYDNSNLGSIYNNDNSGIIYNNSNDGSIYNNSNDGYIHNNSNDGSIYNNSNNGYIQNNSNLGIIQNNSNLGIILNNLNTNDISSNSNLGDIQSNANDSSINSNSNSGEINNNSNTSVIESNSNSGEINSNSNDGRIIQNSNNGRIIQNSNIGTISSNSNTSHIQNNSNINIIGNSNAGDIDSNSNAGDIESNSNAGDINDNENAGDINLNSNLDYIGNNTENVTNINSNSNNGNISSNLNNGNIISNVNNGDIKDNNNNGVILRNSNAGYINNCSASVTSVISNNNNGYIDGASLSGTISDTIVNKT